MQRVTRQSAARTTTPSTPANKHKHIGQLAATNTGTRLLPPGSEGGAGRGSDGSENPKLGGDAFDAAKARAEAYRSNAGDGAESDSSFDSSMSDTDTPVRTSRDSRNGLSPGTIELYQELKQKQQGHGKQPTGRQRSGGEHDDDPEVSSQGDTNDAETVSGHGELVLSPVGVEGVAPTGQVRRGVSSPPLPPGAPPQRQGPGVVRQAPPYPTALATAAQQRAQTAASSTTRGTTPVLPKPPGVGNPNTPHLLPSTVAPASEPPVRASTVMDKRGSGRTPNHDPTITSPPPASPTRGAQTTAEGQVRTEKPNFHLWPLQNLKAEAGKQAGRRKGLKFGPLAEDELKQLSNAKKDELARALARRMEWLEELGQDPEWPAIAVGITPEKRKQKMVQRQAKALKKAEGRGGARKHCSSQQYTIRLACLAILPEFYDDYLRSKGGGDGTGRGEQDARETGANHSFYRRVARAMATKQWRDENGNPLSVPDDHTKDERAPENLKSLLAGVDLEAAAVSLFEEKAKVFKEDAGAFFAGLQIRCERWMKNIRSFHTVYKGNETQSGGAGADEEGGVPADATHPFQFMQGRLATMIWEDGMRIYAGGDDNNQTGQLIIADGNPGAASSVPGGPGVRGLGGAKTDLSTSNSDSDTLGSGQPNSGKTNPGKMTKRVSTKPKMTTSDQKKVQLYSKANQLMDELSSSIKEEATGADSAFAGVEADRARDRVLEELAGDVERLEAKVASATSVKTKQLYQKLLNSAEDRLAKTAAQAGRDEAAAAASSAATSSSTAAPSPAVDVGGGADPAGGASDAVLV